MARGLAFVQLVIVCLGVFTLHLFGKLSHPGEHPGFVDELAFFIGRYGLWLIPLPVLWAVFGNLITTYFGKRAANIVGVILTLFIFGIFAVPILWHLG